MEIPLRNKTGEIIDYCIVSKEDYIQLNSFKWNKKYDGYVIGYVDKKYWRIHRYIMIEILGHDISSKVKIDHINNNPLDNRRENLRIISNSGNNRNVKKKSTDSKFSGVTIRYSRWYCQISIEQKTLYAIYDKEEHAAWHYNLWIEEYDLKFAKKNDITEPDDFVFYYGKKERNLPNGIYYEKNRYSVRITVNKKMKRFGTYKTLEEAIEFREKKVKELKILQNSIKKPILRNDDGFAIIELFNCKKEKTAEAIIDDDLYHEITKYRWYLNNHDYVMGRGESKKLVGLHRYIMNYYGDDFVDHINNNPLDNRRENLRIVTAKQNSQNKSSHSNSTSKYIGVSKNTASNKWVSNITVDGKLVYLDSFDTEIEAAECRDEATRKYFGEFGNYNFE